MKPVVDGPSKPKNPHDTPCHRLLLPGRAARAPQAKVAARRKPQTRPRATTQITASDRRNHAANDARHRLPPRALASKTARCTGSTLGRYCSPRPCKHEGQLVTKDTRPGAAVMDSSAACLRANALCAMSGRLKVRVPASETRQIEILLDVSSVTIQQAMDAR